MTQPHPLSIAMISRYYPPEVGGGGMALSNQTLARELVRQGHRVAVIAASSTGYSYCEVDEGVVIYRIPQWKVHRRSVTGMTCVLNSARIAFTLMRLHRVQPFDVVHSAASFYESLLVGWWLKHAINVPLVVKYHENKDTYQRVEGRLKWLKSLRRQWLRLFLHQVGRHADCILSVSGYSLHSTLDYLGLSQAPCPQLVSPSPLDAEAILPTLPPEGYLETFGLKPDSRFLLYAGRLIHEKGLHLLVEVFLSDLAGRFPNLQLVIAGEFDYRQPHYEQTVRQQLVGHPEAKRVHFAGRIPYEEMPYWYSRCEAFVAPSFCEPSGRVVIEAMACSAVAVTFNHGGPPEYIIHGKNGVLVDEQSAQALGDALALLLDNPEMMARIRAHARYTVVSRFRQDKVASHLAQVYRQLATSVRYTRAVAPTLYPR